MQFPVRAVLLGLLLWLAPFCFAFAIFPLKTSNTPLFETLMPLAVVASALVCIQLYLPRVTRHLVREAAVVGTLWMLVSLLIDLSLFMWGPMKMTFPAYMADIGLIYLLYPMLTLAAALLLRRSRSATA